jgi:hypothetical protein
MRRLVKIIPLCWLTAAGIGKAQALGETYFDAARQGIADKQMVDSSVGPQCNLQCGGNFQQTMSCQRECVRRVYPAIVSCEEQGW